MFQMNFLILKSFNAIVLLMRNFKTEKRLFIQNDDAAFS